MQNLRFLWKKATGARVHYMYLIMCIMTATVKDDIIGVLLCFVDQKLILKVQDIVKGFSTILSFGKRQDFWMELDVLDGTTNNKLERVLLSCILRYNSNQTV